MQTKFIKEVDKVAKCDCIIDKGCERKTIGGKMFRNLEAEQARLGMTDANVAKKLGCARSTYVNKKRSGKFNLDEIIILLKQFNKSFDYLFATDNNEQKAG